MTTTANEEYLRQIQSIHSHILEIQKTYASLAPTLRVVQESYVRYIQESRQQIQKAIQPFIDLDSFIRHRFQQATKPHPETINRIREYVAAITIISGPISFQEAITEAYNEYQRIQTERAVPVEGNHIDSLIGTVEQRVKVAPKTRLSLEFFLGLLFAVFLFVASQNSASDSEERIQQRLAAIENSIAEVSKQLLRFQNDGSFYIVSHAGKLRAAPNGRSSVVADMPTDLRVEVVDRKGKWVKIEFFSSRKNLMQEGWILEEYVYRVIPSRSSR